MGGPMSANDEEKFAWLPIEKQFIYDIIKLGKAALGSHCRSAHFHVLKSPIAISGSRIFA
jgi:hypothetical protein